MIFRGGGVRTPVHPPGYAHVWSVYELVQHMLTKVVAVVGLTKIYYVFCFVSDPPEVELEDVVSVFILKT